MIAPNTTIAIVAKRQYFFQKLEGTIPRTVRPYMRTGSWNAMPKARVKSRTKSMKLSPYRMSRFAPRRFWTENSRLNVKGRMTTKQSATPERKSSKTGTVTRMMSRRSVGFNAGPTNRPTWYTMSGDAVTAARKRATLNMTKYASHG